MHAARLLLAILVVLLAATAQEVEVCADGSGQCAENSADEQPPPQYEENEREQIRRTSDEYLTGIMNTAHAALEVGWVVVAIETMNQAAATPNFKLLCYDLDRYPANVTTHDDGDGYVRVTVDDKESAKLLAWYWNEWSRRAMSLEDHAIMKDAEGGDSEFAQKLRAEDRGQYKDELYLYNMWAEHFPGGDRDLQFLHSTVLEVNGNMRRSWEVAHEAHLAYPQDPKLAWQELRLRPHGNPAVVDGTSDRISGNPYGTEHTGPESPVRRQPSREKGCWQTKDSPGGRLYIARLECCFMPGDTGDWFLHGNSHRKVWRWEADAAARAEKKEESAAIRGLGREPQSARPAWRGKRVALLYHGTLVPEFRDVWPRQQSHVIAPLRAEGASVAIYASVYQNPSGDYETAESFTRAISGAQGDEVMDHPFIFFEKDKAKANKGDLFAAGLALIVGPTQKALPPVGGRQWPGFTATAEDAASVNRTYHRGSAEIEVSSRYEFVVAVELDFFPKVSALAWPVDFSKLNVPFRNIDPKNPTMCTCMVAAAIFAFPPRMAGRVLQGCAPGYRHCHAIGRSFIDVHLWVGGQACFAEDPGWARSLLSHGHGNSGVTRNPYYVMYGKPYAHGDLDLGGGRRHVPGEVVRIEGGVGEVGELDL